MLVSKYWSDIIIVLVWNVFFPKGTDLIDQTLILEFEDFFIFQDFEGETLRF